jgi:catechol 2,3-dioxygenase
MHMTVDHQVAHSVYMGDPDGNEIEFYCDTVKDWRRVLHGEMDLITCNWNPGETEPFSDSRYDLDPDIRCVDEASIHPRRLTHAVLVTKNLERLAQYYEQVAGMDLVHAGKSGQVVFLRGSHGGYRYHLGLCEGKQIGFHHVSFELAGASAVDEAEHKVRSKGVKPERRIDNDWKRSFFLVDPDGMRTEYFVYRGKELGGFDGIRSDEQPYLI